MRCSSLVVYSVITVSLTSSNVRAFSMGRSPVSSLLQHQPGCTSSSTRMAFTLPHNVVEGTSAQLLVSIEDYLGPGDGKIGLILASQSPRRQEILDMMGLAGLFEAVPSPLDETALQIHLMEQEVGIVKMNQCRWSHTISRYIGKLPIRAHETMSIQNGPVSLCPCDVN